MVAQIGTKFGTKYGLNLLISNLGTMSKYVLIKVAQIQLNGMKYCSSTEAAMTSDFPKRTPEE